MGAEHTRTPFLSLNRFVATGPARQTPIDDPSSIAFAPDGDLVFAESGSSSVKRVDSITGVVTPVAGRGTGIGEENSALLVDLTFPRGVEVLGDGRILISDTANNRLLIVDETGGVAQLAELPRPRVCW